MGRGAMKNRQLAKIARRLRKSFLQSFDESSETDVYCKASLLTKTSSEVSRGGIEVKFTSIPFL
jgi:hypothetical protein